MTIGNLACYSNLKDLALCKHHTKSRVNMLAIVLFTWYNCIKIKSLKEITKMTQAKVGGEIGLNGEFYQGGEFLPSSPNTIKGEFTTVKGQKLQVRKEAAIINDRINAELLNFYPSNSVAQARELYAMYLRDNGVNTRNINIYSTDLAKWVL